MSAAASTLVTAATPDDLPASARTASGRLIGWSGEVIRTLWRTHALLTAAGALLLAAAAPALAGLWLDDRVITGAPAWMKPLKFALSTGIYSLTLAWMLSFLTDWPRLRRAAGTLTAVVLLVEVAIIDLQAWRGTASHFNIGTPLDAVLFGIMGTGILLQTLCAAAVAVALCRQRFDDRALGWALRLGLLLTVAGASTGGLMTQPTEAQLAQAAATGRIATAGAHTVGGPDGGPGWPGTGWSREHGDLRVPHFVGLHAMQALPLLALLVGRRRARTRMGVVLGSAVVYGGVFALLLVQALQGRPFLPAATAITPEGVFAAVNLMAVLAWVLLAAIPARPWVTRAVTTGVVPLLLAVVYSGLIATQWGSPGGFSSLADVSRLFSNPWLLLAGWVHYLAFDLLVGSWEVADAQARGLPRLLVVPCLFLTFMFGPAGWLLYRTVATIHGGRPADGRRASGAALAS